MKVRMSIITQREVGRDTQEFRLARSRERSARIPDIILMGELAGL